MEKEMHAVDSEHQKNLQSDGWRAFQLLKSVSAPGTFPLLVLITNYYGIWCP